MYTVKITKELNPSNQRIFTLTYSNGTRTYTESFLMTSYVSADNVAQMANERIVQLTLEDANFDAITAGEITPVPAPAPTQAELDAQALLQKRQVLLQAKQDVDLGLITQADYDVQLSSAQPAITNLLKLSAVTL